MEQDSLLPCKKSARQKPGGFFHYYIFVVTKHRRNEPCSYKGRSRVLLLASVEPVGGEAAGSLRSLTEGVVALSQ